MNKFFIIVFMLLFTGCDTHRDLYRMVSPQIYVEGDWREAFDESRSDGLGGRATAAVYRDDYDGPKLSYFTMTSGVRIRVARGDHKILLFNGLFQSEDETPLDHVWFRNTSSPETFEAYIAEVSPNRFFARSDNEYVASGSMEMIASAYEQVRIEGREQRYVLYQSEEDESAGDYVEKELYPVLRPLSYDTRVTVRVTNPESMARYASGSPVISGSLRGFTGAVSVADRMPNPDFPVTHQFNLNNYREDNGQGVVEASFVSFGPPIDRDPGRRFTLELFVGLINGAEVRRTIDLTERIDELIERIVQSRSDGQPIAPTINLEADIELEQIAARVPVGVSPWGDEEQIPVVIGRKTNRTNK